MGAWTMSLYITFVHSILSKFYFNLIFNYFPQEGSYIEDPNHQGSFKVPVNALNIIWGNDPRFWQVINLSEEETK